ncbi:DNA (cytosine-5)-methyltransferase 1 [Collimonas sp. PA-H2]|uniref:DNA cytosine methyltransferase n=1 Tax=Collimonas sp. PA-H2 TaxID=1881062 RepID=UPI000BF632D4|nr:DNA cytosine methyltransferase [Collimonas sp. PA-H2]PFH10840.1 DNA (cytosine-5)-methyltransferase 1 [Collimonas sp. PA-H2]
MTAYYNEHDKGAAQWLRNLITAGHIAAGDVDERDIRDVRPDDIRGYKQCHFFAGVGVWSYALRRAGWTDDRPVWTGSCPCQPFSAAGKGAGFDDERHLWPAWYHLIGQCKPAIVFGEQVASKDADVWIDLVHDDMEALGYAFGAIPFPSAGVGAPHIRDRLYWLGNSSRTGLERYAGNGRPTRRQGSSRPVAATGVSVRLADHGLLERPNASRGKCDTGKAFGRIEDTGSASGLRSTGRLANSNDERHHGGRIDGHESCKGRGRIYVEGFTGDVELPGPTNGYWSAADWLGCRDGKFRPVEPGTFPLAYGTSSRVGRMRADQERLAALLPRKDQGSRVGRLKGYGNAINAEAAKAFIEAVMD